MPYEQPDNETTLKKSGLLKPDISATTTWSQFTLITYMLFLTKLQKG